MNAHIWLSRLPNAILTTFTHRLVKDWLQLPSDFTIQMLSDADPISD
jgi:hypothetical protein